MKERILAFMQDLESKNPELIAKWFTNESILWIPPSAPVTGLARIKALFRTVFARYESLHWKVIEILPLDECRCIHITESHGTMHGNGDYSNRIITDIVFNEDGKITSLSDYFKDTAIFTIK